MLTSIRDLIFLIMLTVSFYANSSDLASLDKLDITSDFASDIEEQLGDKQIWKAYSSDGSGFWLLSTPQLIASELCRARLFYGEFGKEGPIINRPDYVRKVRYFYAHHTTEKISLTSCSDITPDSYFEVTSPIEEGTLNELSAFINSELENIRGLVVPNLSDYNRLSILAIDLPPLSALHEKYMYRVVLRDSEAGFAAIAQVKKTPDGFEVVSVNKLNKD